MADEDETRAAIMAAAAIALTLPEATLPGVVANRTLLAEHRARIVAALAETERS